MDTTAFAYSIWKCLNEDATSGTCARCSAFHMTSTSSLRSSPMSLRRFKKAATDWCNSQGKQVRNRSVGKIPPVAEFIMMRRETVGGFMAAG